MVYMGEEAIICSSISMINNGQILIVSVVPVQAMMILYKMMIIKMMMISIGMLVTMIELIRVWLSMLSIVWDSLCY